MTTAPVPSITEDLLADLDRHSEADSLFSDAAATIRAQAAELERCKAGLNAQPEDFCFCDDHVSLQMVSGGASERGYLGEVTLCVDGEYVTYWRLAPAAPAHVAQEPVRELIGYACDRRGALILDRCGDCLCWPAHENTPPAAEQPDTVAVPRRLLDELDQFLTDTLTAADLVRRGGRSKALADRLREHFTSASKLRALLAGGDA